MSAQLYEMVVGLEVHVQLRTHSKAFCSCSTDFGAPPNSNTCPICLALPGALPVLNEQAVALAVRAALSLGCTVNAVSVFARKNYFYPDLPKGYQITQADQPLAVGGRVAIGELPDGEPLTVRVRRVHMEEDAGKSLHDRYGGMTAIDLNRAGVPLIEIVSEPDMRSAPEAGAYLRTLKQMLEYAGVSDVSMEEGSLRVDANVSARPRGDTELGTRTEVKNMNSFSGVERAVTLEFERQCAALTRGERIVQQTMLWDAAANEVRAARSKEESHDYRYFAEPDLPPLILSSDFVTRQRNALPESPSARKARYATEYALPSSDIELLTSSPALGDYFETTARAAGDARQAANWVMGELLAAVNARGFSLDAFPVRPSDLAQLLAMVRDGLVSHSGAKTLFAAMVETGQPAPQLAAERGLIQVSDDSTLLVWIDEAIAENPAEAARLRGGEKKLTGVFVGAVMKKSRGSADPRRVTQLLPDRLGG